MRTGSVWPVVFAHAAVSHVNIRVAWTLADADAPFDPLHAGLIGWPGWIAMGAFVAVLAATGQFRQLAGADRPPSAPAPIGG
jgi:hypothetical protein